MDITELGQFITNYGVMTAFCVALFYLWKKETEAHQSESKNFTEALNQLTVVLNKILTKIGADE